MKNLSNLLYLSTLLILSACSTEKISEQEDITQQESFKAFIESSEEFNAIKDQLVKLTEYENEELEAIETEHSSGVLRSVDEDEPFVFLIIGDSELNMRGNTYNQLFNWVDKINNIETLDLEFLEGDFEEGESKKILKPELVFLAGDINKDRSFGLSLPNDENDVSKRETNRLFNQFDEDILFFPGNGNHDWDPYQFADNSYGHNLGGLFSNLGTAQFVRSRYNRALRNTDLESGATFNYDRNRTWFPLISSAEFNYSFVYKGLRFTQLNQFLQEPISMVSFESLSSSGPAWYYENSTSPWFQNLCNLSKTNQNQHVVIQHFPILTGDGWWNDDLGGTPDGLRKEFMEIFEDAYQPVMFTGHNHNFRKTNVMPYNIEDYTSGYFANGFVIAVKASKAKGIYSIAFVDLNNEIVFNPSSFSSTYVIPQ